MNWVSFFETASPFETPRKMESLVAWTAKAISEETLHPLQIIAVFVVVFLAIHPFQDGNGRLSRVLTTLLLLRAGYDYVPLCIAGTRDRGKQGPSITRPCAEPNPHSMGNNPDWVPWVGFYLRCLKKQKDGLADRLDWERLWDRNESDLQELSVRILAQLRLRERQTIAQLADATGANRNTLKVRLRELVESGKIRRHGKARGTWYSL